MSRKTSEDLTLTTPDRLGEEAKCQSTCEGEEKDMPAEQEAMVQEDEEASREKVEGSKKKPARVQSVFGLVRHQVRTQPAAEARKSGLLQLVHQVTSQLDRSGVKEQKERGDIEVTTFEEISKTEQDTEDKDECVTLLQEVLSSVEALRKEVREEIALLRQESRSCTEEAARGLETRLATLLSIDANEKTNDSQALTFPPLPGAARKRALRRTMTNLAMTSGALLALRPRCMSEPVVSQAGSVSNGVGRTLRKGAEAPRGTLLPSIPAAKQTRKELRSKNRTVKPTA